MPLFLRHAEAPDPESPRRIPRVRKATTVRLDPQLQEGLMLLQAVLEKPLNRMVNEAVRRFIETRTAEVESDLQQVLTRVRAYRRSDPNFGNAIAQFVSAETSLASNDPVEGSTPATAAARNRLGYE